MSGWDLVSLVILTPPWRGKDPLMRKKQDVKVDLLGFLLLWRGFFGAKPTQNDGTFRGIV